MWGPAYRALIDKIWVTHQNLGTIGQWAQLQTVADFIAAPAFLGVGFGLTVLIAQSKEENHSALLLSSCILGWLTCAPLLLGLIFFSTELAKLLSLDAQFESSLILISIIGWLGISGGQLCSFWLGKEMRGKILLFTFMTGMPGIFFLLYVLWEKSHNPIQVFLNIGLYLSLIFNLWIVYILTKHCKKGSLSRAQIKAAMISLMHYLPAGFSIGILTPVSALIVRSVIAHQLNWEAAGTATALWRASDWILNCSQGVLYYCFLPKLSGQVLSGNLFSLMRKISLIVLLPTLLAFLLLQLYRQPFLIWLYNEHLVFDWKISALFWTGDIFRILAGIFLMGLYALKATKSISFGELLSQPLFALLLFLGIGNSLEFVGMYHCITYIIYAFFCISMFYLITQELKFNFPTNQYHH